MHLPTFSYNTFLTAIVDIYLQLTHCLVVGVVHTQPFLIYRTDAIIVIMNIIIISPFVDFFFFIFTHNTSTETFNSSHSDRLRNPVTVMKTEIQTLTFPLVHIICYYNTTYLSLKRVWKKNIIWYTRRKLQKSQLTDGGYLFVIRHNDTEK